MERRPSWSTAPVWAAPVAMGALYALGAELTWRFFGAGTTGMVFYPPAGITLSALATVPRRRWPALLAAAGAAELVVDFEHGIAAPIAAGYAAANVIEPAVGAWLLRSRAPGEVGGLRLDRRIPMLWFVACAMVVGPLTGATAGATVKLIESGTPWWLSALQWWAGDALGVLAIGAPLLVWWHTEPRRGRRSELVLAAVTASVGSAAAFAWLPTIPTVVVLPVLLWGALRLGVWGVAALAPIVCVAANATAAAGTGALAVIGLTSPEGRMGMTQAYLAVVVLTAWFVAVGIGERLDLERSFAREQVEGDRLRLAAAAADLLVYDARLTGGGALVTLNLEGVLGVPAGSRLTIDDWQARIHPHDQVRYLAEIDEDGHAGQPRTTRYRVRHEDGRWLHVEDHRLVERDGHGRPARLIGAIRDVTADQVRLETAQRLMALAGRVSAARTVDGLQGAIIGHGAAALGADAAALFVAGPGRLAPRPVPGEPPVATDEWPDTNLDGSGALAEAVRTGRPVVDPAPDGREPSLPRDRPTAQAGRFRTWVAVPLHAGDAVWGVAIFGFGGRLGTFDVDVLDLPGTADRWSSALRRVLAHEREQEARAQLTRLQAITAALAAAPTAVEIAHVLAAAATELGAESIEIDRHPVPDRSSAELRQHLARAPAGTILRFAIGTDVVESVVLTVTLAGGEPDESTRALFETIASLTKQALRRTALVDIEHMIAIELQRALLGTPDPVGCLDVGTTYQASQRGLEVGGDWYDVIATPTGALLIVGDVVGHSLQAATAMGHLRSATRAIAAETSAPDELLTRLDRFALTLDNARCATVVAVRIDPGTRGAIISTAGHPPPLLITAAGDARFIEDGRGPPLATVPGKIRPTTAVPFAPGDQLVLYTDGLVERRRVSIDTGLARLRDAALAARHQPPETHAAHLVAQLADKSAEDDMAVLIVRSRVPAPAAGAPPDRALSGRA